MNFRSSVTQQKKKAKLEDGYGEHLEIPSLTNFVHFSMISSALQM